MEIKVSGHRGYRAKEIENTLASFTRATDEGIDYVELDVRKTSENIPIVFHDSRLNRLVNGKGKINNYTLKELKDFSYEDGQKILTLEELFTQFRKKIKFIIDIKATGIESEIISLIEKFSLEKDVILQSLRGKIIKKCYKLAPDLDYAVYRALIGKSTRPHKLFTPIWYYILVKRYNLTYVSLDGPFMYNRFISKLNKNGIKIILGAMNVEKYIRYVKKWKIDIINADNPEIIKKTLAELEKNNIL